MRQFWLAIALLFSLSLPPETFAQTNGGGNTGNNAPAGIRIDASGAVQTLLSKSQSPQLLQKQLAAFARKNFTGELNQQSAVRMVSLPKLEQAYQECIEQGKPIPLEMQYLAGLLRIDSIFVDQDAQDLVIAGPAEAFAPDDLGRMVGITSHRPPIQLDDLLVALRSRQTMMCSIDPLPDKLNNLQQYISSARPTSVHVAKSRYKTMAKILGNQVVTVAGVPADSHFALAMVEADIRMKHISIGIEKVKVPRFKSHLAMMRPGGNSIQRWWFVPLYAGLTATETGDAYQLAGQRAQLLSQEELVDAAGNRFNAAQTRVSTETYARHFTEKYPELAEAVPAFAQLQNLMDLSILSALFEQEQLPERIDWKMRRVLDPELAKIKTYNVAKAVPSSFNYKMAGRNMVVGLIAGGVRINLPKMLQQMNRQTDTGGLGDKRQAALANKNRVRTRWWWD